MRFGSTALVCLLFLVLARPAASQSPYAEAADRLAGAALADSVAFDRMAYQGDTFGTA